MENSGVKDTSYLVSSKIFVIFLALGTRSCLAWVLAPEGVGKFSVCFLYALFLSAFLIIGCEMVTQYYIISKRFTVSEAVTYALIYGLIGCCVSICVGLVILHIHPAILSSFLQKADTGQFYLALASIPASLFVLTFIRMLAGLREFKWCFIGEVTHAFLLLVLTLIFVLGFKMGVTGALWAFILSAAIAIVVVISMLLWKYHLKLVRPSLKKLLGMFNYGFRYHPGKISNVLNTHIGVMILACFFPSISDVGLFATAAALMLKVEILPNALVMVLMPRVADDKHGRRELVAQCFRVMLIIYAAMLLCLGLVIIPLVPIAFSPKFKPIILLIWLLIPGIFVRSTCKVIIPYMLGTDRPGYLSISVGAGMIANVIAMYLLLPVIKLPAASVAMSINYIVSSAILFCIFRRVSGMRLRDIFRFRRDDWTMLVQFIKSRLAGVKILRRVKSLQQ